MTPLQALILSELQKLGPMRDIELWQRTTEVAMLPITIACFSLEADGYIEVPPGLTPQSYEWQITAKGREYVTKQLGGGVHA